MHKDVKAAIKLRELFETLHANTYKFLTTTQDNVIGMKITLEDLCDMGLLCREMERFMEEIRKEVKSRKELVGKLIAAAVAQKNLSDPGNPVLTIKGEIASGTPDFKIIPKIPKKGTPEHDALMEHLGVDKSIVEQGCVKLSFGGMGEYVTKLAELGKPTPPGVEKTWTQFTTKFLRRKKRKSNDH